MKDGTPEATEKTACVPAVPSIEWLSALERAFQKRAETLGSNAKTVTDPAMKLAMLTAALSLSNCATAVNDLRLEAEADNA